MLGKRQKQEARLGETVSVAITTALEADNRRLQHAIAQLSLLNELALAVGLSESSEDMIAAIVRRAKRALEAEQVMIYFVEHGDDRDLLKTKVREDSRQQTHSFHFDLALCGMMEVHRAPFLTNDPHHERRLAGVKLDPALRSLLCVPLLVRGVLIGIVVACNKHGEGSFTEEDQRLLAIMANQSAQLLENRRLREEEEAYAQLRLEVETARNIQVGLLPKDPPQLAGYDLAGCSVPAEIVGGDYFDFFELSEGRLGICLGDVSGKGIPAALLMANLQATLRGQAHTSSSACECVARANHLLFRSTSADKFATLFYGVLDTRTHELSYCNAGHERPLLLSCTEDGNCRQELAEGGLVLGILDESTYAEGRVALAPGSVLLLYSDGLTDAVDEDDRPFGVAAAEAVLRRHRDAPAAELVEALLAAVKRHAAAAPPYDDMTIIAVRRLS
jgi:phosphoserine phosphatase RsbU/P